MKVITDNNGDTISVRPTVKTIEVEIYDESVELDEEKAEELIRALQEAKESIQ